MPSSFEEIKIGDRIDPMVRSISRKDVEEFGAFWALKVHGRNVRRDHPEQRENPLGVNLPAPMPMLYLYHLLDRWAPGAQVKTIDVVWRQVVKRDLPIAFAGIVTDTHVQDGHGVVEVDLSVKGPKGEVLWGGRATLHIPLSAKANAV